MVSWPFIREEGGGLFLGPKYSTVLCQKLPSPNLDFAHSTSSSFLQFRALCPRAPDALQPRLEAEPRAPDPHQRSPRAHRRPSRPVLPPVGHQRGGGTGVNYSDLLSFTALYFFLQYFLHFLQIFSLRNELPPCSMSKGSPHVWCFGVKTVVDQMIFFCRSTHQPIQGFEKVQHFLPPMTFF